MSRELRRMMVSSADVMHLRFSVPIQVDGPDLAAMTVLVERMERVVEGLVDLEHRTWSDPIVQDFVGYCRSLVENQRESLGRTKPGSWSVAVNDDHMPSDARCDFIFRPTYAAVSALTWLVNRHPGSIEEIPRLLQSVRSGLRFCEYRGLEGHGYGGENDSYVALRLLCLGDVPGLLKLNPTLAPRLRAILHMKRREAEMLVLGVRESSSWGMSERVREVCSEAIEAYDRSLSYSINKVGIPSEVPK